MFRYLILLAFSICINFLSAQNVDIHRIELPAGIKIINCIVCEKDSVVWIGTSKGLVRVLNGSVKVFFDDSHLNKFKINTIAIDSSGGKWLGTYQSSIIKFDNGIESKEISFMEIVSSRQLVTSMSVVRNKLLVTTSEGNVLKYLISDQLFVPVTSPFQNAIYSSYIDESDNIWLCSSDGLFNRLKTFEWQNESRFKTAYGIFRKQKEFWAAGRTETDKAVLMLLNKRAAGVFTKEQTVWDELALDGLPNPYVKINQLVFDNKEIIWFATDDGLIKYTPFDGVGYVVAFDNAKELKLQNVTNIAFQNKGKGIVWFSANGNELYKVEIK